VRHPLRTAKCIPIRPRPLLALLHVVDGRQPRRLSPDKEFKRTDNRRRPVTGGGTRRPAPHIILDVVLRLAGAVRPLNTHTHHHSPSIAATAAPPNGVVAGRLTGGGTRRPEPHGGVSGRPHGTGDGAATGRYRLRSQHSLTPPPSVPLCLLPLLLRQGAERQRRAAAARIVRRRSRSSSLCSRRRRWCCFWYWLSASLVSFCLFTHSFST
jgi:hypothetical protein